MDKIEFKKMTVSEIKAMLSSEQIVLRELDNVSLERLLDYETDMLCYGKGDVDLISECADILSQRENDIISHEDYMAIVDNALEGKRTKEQKTKRFGLKKTLIIAAAVATLVIGGTVVASGLSLDLWNCIAKTVVLPDGTKSEHNGFTFFVAGAPTVYSSLEEGMEKEGLDLLYTESLPEGVEIDEVQIARSTIGDRCILILTKNDEVIISIDTDASISDNAFAEGELYECNGVTYKLFEGELEHKYGAFCYVDNCVYMIQTKEYDDLIFVIENMKEK